MATGYVVEDVMLKAGSVQLLLARSICSGKFLIVVAGDVASVTAAVEAGGAAAGPSLIERRQIARVHPSVFPAISNAVDIAQAVALHRRHRDLLRGQHHRGRGRGGQIRQRTLLRVHLAMALGGKGFVLMAGDVASVQAAVAAGSKVAAEEGMLVGRAVIAAPSGSSSATTYRNEFLLVAGASDCGITSVFVGFVRKNAYFAPKMPHFSPLLSIRINNLRGNWGEGVGVGAREYGVSKATLSRLLLHCAPAEGYFRQ